LILLMIVGELRFLGKGEPAGGWSIACAGIHSSGCGLYNLEMESGIEDSGGSSATWVMCGAKSHSAWNTVHSPL